MVTLPINPKYVEAVSDKADDIISDKAEDIVNDFIFNSLEDIIAFSNGVSNGVSNTAKEIITKELHYYYLY